MNTNIEYFNKYKKYKNKYILLKGSAPPYKDPPPYYSLEQFENLTYYEKLQQLTNMFNKNIINKINNDIYHFETIYINNIEITYNQTIDFNKIIKQDTLKLSQIIFYNRFIRNIQNKDIILYDSNNYNIYIYNNDNTYILFKFILNSPVKEK